MPPDSNSEIGEEKQTEEKSPRTRVLAWTAVVAACIAIITALLGQLVTIREAVKKLWGVDPLQITMRDARASEPREIFSAGRGNLGEPIYAVGIRAVMEKKGTPAVRDCMGQLRFENGDQFNAVLSGSPRFVEGDFEEDISYSFEIPKSVYPKRMEFRVWCRNTKSVSPWLNVELISPQ